jgi:hypothetical protein
VLQAFNLIVSLNFDCHELERSSRKVFRLKAHEKSMKHVHLSSQIRYFLASFQQKKIEIEIENEEFQSQISDKKWKINI